ncbi:hypothetical protein JZO83_08395 [Enterococcus sp. DIV1298c]|uniref:hypothetical protein n=1 Tax=Enterococcus sp. DIV1298c TaxID=2815328 RepID=UPI001A920EC0|nr:hypothetical protein [Enterococcus sp. DIV1298c]MBO0461769.1 hypothetical protein [Enterococcus sp. DIV1298c]
MKKRSLVHILVTVLFVIVFGAFFSTDVQADESLFKPTTERVGVWWWDTSNLNLAHSESYLDYAKNNGITEIYLNQTELHRVNPNNTFGPNGTIKAVIPTQNFIQAANDRDIDVYLLLSNDGTWLNNPNRFHLLMKGYLAYQNVAKDAQFAGVHLNVEPNQLRDSTGERYWDKGYDVQARMMQQLIDFAVDATNVYGDYTTFDWSTGMWWDRDRYPVTYRGKKTLLYRAMIEEANTTVVMSFRTTANAIAEASKNHLAYARNVGKPIILSGTVFLSGEEPDKAPNAQFVGFGRDYMHRELAKVPEYALKWADDANGGASDKHLDVHIAFHEMMTWRHWERRER